MPTKKHASTPDTGETKPKRKYTRKQTAGGGGLQTSVRHQADDITFTINGPFARQFMHGLITGALAGALEGKSAGQLGGTVTHLGPENV